MVSAAVLWNYYYVVPRPQSLWAAPSQWLNMAKILSLVRHRTLPTGKILTWGLPTDIDKKFFETVLQSKILSIQPSFFPSLLYRGQTYTTVWWISQCSSASCLFLSKTVFPNKSRTHILPHWHLLLKGPNLTYLLCAKHCATWWKYSFD